MTSCFALLLIGYGRDPCAMSALSLNSFVAVETTRFVVFQSSVPVLQSAEAAPANPRQIRFCVQPNPQRPEAADASVIPSPTAPRPTHKVQSPKEAADW